jgi:putative peptidoglycan lipid II flippase
MKGDAHGSARTATGLALAGLLVPAAGFAAEVALAWRFGTSGVVDAFRVSGVYLVLGQHLLLVHLLPQLVVPLAAEYRARGRDAEGWRLAMALANLFGLASAAAAAVAFLWPEPVLALLAPGLVGPGRTAAVTMVRWFAPVFPLLAWSGVAAGLLQFRRVFWVAPASQLATHLLITSFVLAAGAALGAGALVTAVLAGAGLTTLLHVARLAKLEDRPGPVSPWRAGMRHAGLGRALGMAVPLAVLFLVAQLAPVVINRVISEGPPGTLAAFGYAFKLGLAATLAPAALATALFPRLAEQRFAEDPAAFAGLAERALAMAVFLSVPAAAALVMLREPIVALALERGAFGAEATARVARLFGWLVAGAPAAVALAFLEKMHFALGRMWTPAIVRVALATALVALAPAASRAWGAEGVAAAFSAVSLAAAMVLAGVLRRAAPAMRLGAVARGGATVVLLALVATWIGGQATQAAQAGAIANSSLALLLAVAAGVVTTLLAYVAGAHALGLPEAAACSRYIRWQGFETWKRIAARRVRGAEQ